MPRLDHSHPFPAQPDYLSERADENAAQNAALRAYMQTAQGIADTHAGKLDEFLADLDDDKERNYGD